VLLSANRNERIIGFSFIFFTVVATIILVFSQVLNLFSEHPMPAIPYISELAFHPPASFIFKYGLTLIGIAIICLGIIEEKNPHSNTQPPHIPLICLIGAGIGLIILANFDWINFRTVHQAGTIAVFGGCSFWIYFHRFDVIRPLPFFDQMIVYFILLIGSLMGICTWIGMKGIADEHILDLPRSNILIIAAALEWTAVFLIGLLFSRHGIRKLLFSIEKESE